ncbi:MAG: NAD(P)H-dependent oxidoreductase [Bacteroidota bacterium]
MIQIAIISSSIRKDRKSNRVALFFKYYLEENNLAQVDLLDLKEYAFPLFDERLKFQENPSANTLDFAEKIRKSDGVIIVSPEYNGSIPASLKNVIDLLTDDWKGKPIAISTVSSGIFAGSQVLGAIQFTLWKIRAWTVPALFPVPEIEKSFDENGNPSDKTTSEKRALNFLNELFWCIEAKKRMIN